MNWLWAWWVNLSDITVMAGALVAIAAALWKKELVRLARWTATHAKKGWAWLRAKRAAFRAEVRAFADWVFMPEPFDLDDCLEAADIKAVDVEGGNAYFVTWPDEPAKPRMKTDPRYPERAVQSPADDPWCTTPGEPHRDNCPKSEVGTCSCAAPAPKPRPKPKRRPKKPGA